MLCVFNTTSIKKCKLNYTYMSTSLVYCPKLYNSNCWQLKFTCEIEKVSYFSIKRQKDERLYHFSEHGTIIVIRWKVSQSFYVPQIWKEFFFVNCSGVNQTVVSGNSSFIWSELPWISLNYYLELRKGFPGGSVVKNLPAMQETQEMWVQFLGWKESLEEEMAKHSSVLAWRIPWTEEPGGLQSIELQRVGYNWSDWTRWHRAEKISWKLFISSPIPAHIHTDTHASN